MGLVLPRVGLPRGEPTEQGVCQHEHGIELAKKAEKGGGAEGVLYQNATATGQAETA
jgi:hypothetical protein